MRVYCGSWCILIPITGIMSDTDGVCVSVFRRMSPEFLALLQIGFRFILRVVSTIVHRLARGRIRWFGSIPG